MDQPASVQHPTGREAMPFQQVSPPAPHQQQQLQQVPNPQPNSQQYVVYGMQPYTVSPLQQHHYPQQQQIVALQPVLAPGALQPARFHTTAPQLYPQFPAHGNVFIESAPPGSHSADRRYKIKFARGLGILQIVLALSSAVLGIVALIVKTRGGFVAAPLWAGILFYLPSGVLGITSTKPTSMQIRVIKACMGMSIISSVLAGGILVYGITAVFFEKYGYYDSFVSYYTITKAGNIVVDLLVALVGLVECVTAILQAAYCCHGVCECCGPKPSGMVQNYAPPVRYVVQQPNQSMQPMMGYPVEAQRQQQQQQQQQQPVVLQGQQPQQVHHRQKVIAVQSAPVRDENPSGNAATSPADEDGPNLPVYTDSPPPSYSLSTGHM